MKSIPNSITPKNNIEFSNLKVLQEQILKLLSNDKKNIILTLENVEKIDGSGIALLIAAQKSIKEREGHLELHSINTNIKNLFKILQLDKYFNIKSEIKNVKRR